VTVVREDLPAIRIKRGPETTSIIRGIARIGLAIGLLVAGFIVYQFGVTSLLAHRGQTELRSQLDIRIETGASELVVYEPLELAQSPIAVPFDLPAFDPASLPGLDPVSLESPVADFPGEEFGEPVIVFESVPVAGRALGRIVIPAAGVDWAVVEGVTRENLKSGAGHMPETALPGQQGNAVISGHRSTYGAPFLHLHRVTIGDVISVETATGTHVYQVVDTFVVEPHDTWVTDQWDGAWLTLTTCEPVLSASQRLVVVATLVAGPNAGTILAGT